LVDDGPVNGSMSELSINSDNYITLQVSARRIAQIIFFETGPILKKDYTANGKYAASTDIKKLQKAWKPESMLPKLYMDKDIKKKQPWHKKERRA
jgi:hypothetical protein